MINEAELANFVLFQVPFWGPKTVYTMFDMGLPDVPSYKGTAILEKTVFSDL